MRIRPARIAIVAVAAEIFAVLALVMLVALLGPREPSAAQAYAEQLGARVGPLAGFVFCLLGGWWVARGLPEGHVLNGAALGAAVAVIDVSILVLGGMAFRWIFVAANLGRIAAGTLGGWIAMRRDAPRSVPAR